VDLESQHRWWKTRGRGHVNRVLHDEWNPIGCSVPSDEYSAYADTLRRLLYDGRNAEEIATFLAGARQHMGLDSDVAADLDVAAQLVAWFQTEDSTS
jgi:hypothetical protein